MLRKLPKGQVFGDIGTVLQSTYRASVMTNTHVELLSIAWSDLIRVLAFYPEIRQRAHQHTLITHGVDVSELHRAA